MTLNRFLDDILWGHLWFEYVSTSAAVRLSVHPNVRESEVGGGGGVATPEVCIPQFVLKQLFEYVLHRDRKEVCKECPLLLTTLQTKEAIWSLEPRPSEETKQTRFEPPYLGRKPSPQGQISH